MPGKWRFGSTRRDFLKLVGGSMGCLLLSSCGGSGGGPGAAALTPLPNGYIFTRIFTPGDGVLPGISTLTPQVLMDDSGHVFFYGQDAQGIFGMHELSVDYSGASPRAVQGRTMLAAGHTMPDGRVVSTIGSVDVNRRGNAAMVLNFDAALSPEGSGPTSIVLDHEDGLDTIFDFGDEAPGNSGQYGEFGDLDPHEEDLLFVGRYGGDGQTSQGVVFTPAESPASGLIVIGADDEIPNADGTVNTLGLIDLDDAGNYVVQAFGAASMALPRTQEKASPGSFIMQGNVRQPLSEARLLTAGRQLTLNRSARANPPALGTSLHGPRIGGQGVTAVITEDGVGNLALYRNEVVIAQTGQLSPGGSPIRIIVPAVVNASGLTFYEVATDQGIELCLHNGQTSALLLARGTQVEGVVVDTIAFGFHTTQADSAGRIVSYVQMANGQESILLGIPV